MRKEFGKQKLYFPPQDGLAVLSPADKAAQEAENKRLAAALREEEEALSALRKGALKQAGGCWMVGWWSGWQATAKCMSVHAAWPGTPLPDIAFLPFPPTHRCRGVCRQLPPVRGGDAGAVR